jgi:hypothetical protein
MAEEQKPATNISPAPSEVADKPANGTDNATPSQPPAASTSSSNGPQQTALSDGTVPVVLTPGESHAHVVKGKTSLAGVYRRADILSTLLTFGGAVAAALLILGVYVFISRPKATPVAIAPKVSSLSSSDLSKLNDFFGGNTAGNPSQVLTVNSSSLFDGRVAVNSDLKVVGGAEVAGTTALSALTVDSTSTLSITNIRGQLTVAGPTSLSGPTVMGDGLAVTGNTNTTGNGSFGGSVAAGTINTSNLSVTGAFNLLTHVNTEDGNPTISGGTINGTDTTGSLTITGDTATVTFHTAYTRDPIVMLTPTSSCPGDGQFYIQSTGGSGFIVNNPAHCPSFNYWVAQ